MLIEVLESLGISASYKEIRKHEIVAVELPARNIEEPAFMQFVFDTAWMDIIRSTPSEEYLVPLQQTHPLLETKTCASSVLSDECGKPF